MSQKKVLIIDYDAESLKSLTDFAQDQGCEVVTASDGITGLEKFKSERPDLVIMEAMLPKLHGFELCKKIAYDSAKKVPVIIVTGIYRESVYKSEAIRFYGASAFFEKPWKQEELQPVFQSLLKGDKQPASEAAPPESEEILPEPPPVKEKKEKKEKKDDFSEEWGLLMPDESASAPAAPVEGTANVEAEIDTMLKSALADLGLKSKQEEKPEPHKEKAKPPKETPIFSPPAVEEAAVPLHREHEDRPAAVKPATIPFGGFIEEPEKKKSKSGLLIGLGLIVVVVAALFLFVLKPKKTETPPVETTQTETAPAGDQTPSEPVPGATDLGAAVQPSTTQPGAAEPQTKTQAPESKPAAKPEAKPAGSGRPQTATPSSSRTSDALVPIMPTETPSLQVREEPKPPAQKPAETTPPAPEAAAPVVRKAQDGDLVPLEQVDTQPVKTKDVRPAYPEMARRAGIEGVVAINALISENGDVIQTTILRNISGSFGFDRATETAVRQWKFRPAIKDGARVKVWKPFNIAFRK